MSVSSLSIIEYFQGNSIDFFFTLKTRKTRHFENIILYTPSWFPKGSIPSPPDFPSISKKVFDKKFRKKIFLLSSLSHSAKRLAFNKTVAFYFIFLFFIFAKIYSTNLIDLKNRYATCACTPQSFDLTFQLALEQ